MDPNTQQTGTAAGTAPEYKLHVAKNEDGNVEIGTWKTPPDGYTNLTTRTEVLDALAVFSRSDLAEQIAKLCGV